MELTEWWNIIGKEQAVSNGPGIGLGPDLKNSIFDVVSLAWSAALSTNQSVGTSTNSAIMQRDQNIWHCRDCGIGIAQKDSYCYSCGAAQ